MSTVIRGNDNFDSSSVGPPTTSNSVGTYGFLRYTGGEKTNGSTLSGSSFNGWSNGYGYTATSPTPAGTWRCMGYSGSQFTSTAGDTLWVRIS